MFKKANYIYTIYTEGSFTRAAEKLYVSQPCLSAAVKRTEQLVGAPLFVRGGSGVQLTELGVEYIRSAEQILAVERRFSHKLQDINALNCGMVRVGGSNYISSYILPRIVEAFAGKYPNVTVSLTEADSGKLTELLETEQLDLVVDSFDEVPEGNECRPLRQEKILLAVPGSFACNRHLSGKGITPAALYEAPDSALSLLPVSAELFRQERFILLKAGNSMHTHAMEVFRQAGFMPQVSLFLDQLSTSYSLAAQGSGCCFVTDTVFRYHRFDDPIFLYHVTGSGHRELGIVSKADRYLTPAQLAFMDTAKASIA